MIVNRSNSCPYCGPDHDNSCYITYSDGDFCFSCGKGHRKGEEYYVYKTQNLVASGEFIVPEYTANPKEFSLFILEWLYQYYISDDLIKLYKIAYCAPQAGKSESVLLPIVDDNYEMVAYQRRFFPDKTFYSSPGLRDQLFVPGYTGTEETVVLVEDYISAIRVGEHGPTMCIFGTSLNRNQIDFIVKTFSKVVIWLDDDEPGRKAAHKIRSRLYSAYVQLTNMRAYSAREVVIKTVDNEKQPKENSPNEIKNILSC